VQSSLNALTKCHAPKSNPQRLHALCHRGEEWLEDCRGISQEGDSFGTIACRIAFATLYVAAQDALCELQDELEDAA